MDDTIIRATEIAARLEVPPPATQVAEIAHLTPAFKAALMLPQAGHKPYSKKLALPSWSPSPGPVDVVLGDAKPYNAVIEIKVNDLGWCLWDLVKVASLISDGAALTGI